MITMFAHFIIFIGGVAIRAATAFAADPIKATEQEFCDYFGSHLTGNCGEAGTAFIVLLAYGIALFVRAFIPAACVLAVIWGGIRIIASPLDEGGREEGKNIIKFALMGLVLAIAAILLLNFVCLFVGNGVGVLCVPIAFP